MRDHHGVDDLDLAAAIVTEYAAASPGAEPRPLPGPDAELALGEHLVMRWVTPWEPADVPSGP